MHSLARYLSIFILLTCSCSRLDDSSRISSNKDPLTREEFVQIVDAIGDSYAEIFASLGGNLVLEKKWEGGYPDMSYAERDGVDWKVVIHGSPNLSPGALTLLVCHEFGHHLAGYPLKRSRWSAAEGNADHFASQSCLRMLWAEEDNTGYSNQIPYSGVSKCNMSWTTANERSLCYRILKAALDITLHWSYYPGGPWPPEDLPDISSPDDSVVEVLDEYHPEPQCRLDTYVAGALCKENYDYRSIPNSYSEAREVSCLSPLGENVGDKPRCWYGPPAAY